MTICTTSSSSDQDTRELHYLMLTDDDFQEASQWAVQTDSACSLREPSGQKGGKITAGIANFVSDVLLPLVFVV